MFKKALAAMSAALGSAALIGVVVAAAPNGCEEPNCNHPEFSAAQKQACEDRLKEVQRNLIPNDGGVRFQDQAAAALPPPTAYAACGEVWNQNGFMNSMVVTGMSKVWSANGTPMMVSIPDWGGGTGRAIKPGWKAPHTSAGYNFCGNPALEQPRFRQSYADIEYDITQWPDPWLMGQWQAHLGDLMPTHTFMNWKIGDYQQAHELGVPASGCLRYVWNFTMFHERGRTWDGNEWHEYWTSNRANYWSSRDMVPGPDTGSEYHLALEAVDPYITGVVGRPIDDIQNDPRLVYGEIELPDPATGGVARADYELDCYSRLEWSNIAWVMKQVGNGCQPGYCGY